MSGSIIGEDVFPQQRVLGRIAGDVRIGRLHRTVDDAIISVELLGSRDVPIVIGGRDRLAAVGRTFVGDRGRKIAGSLRAVAGSDLGDTASLELVDGRVTILILRLPELYGAGARIFVAAGLRCAWVDRFGPQRLAVPVVEGDRLALDLSVRVGPDDLARGTRRRLRFTEHDVARRGVDIRG